MKLLKILKTVLFAMLIICTATSWIIFMMKAKDTACWLYLIFSGIVIAYVAIRKLVD